MKHPAAHVFEFSPASLATWLGERGMPKYRAQQVLEWVYAKRVIDPGQMSNLSKRDRDLLADKHEGMAFLTGEVVKDQHASDGTRKLLVQWSDFADSTDKTDAARFDTELNEHRELTDGHAIATGLRLPVLSSNAGALGSDTTRQTECVMIPAGGTTTLRQPSRGQEWEDSDDRAGDADHRSPGEDADPTERVTRVRRTACISSQVGCPVGCKFCASGIGGLDGNLSAGRIVEQVWRLGGMGQAGEKGANEQVAAAIDPLADRITNVVFMGMGEPLSNFQNVASAVRILTAPWGLGVGARRITISTVGLPAAIEKLADELEVPVTLALSLHAPNDEIRRRLIPWAEYTTIPELLSACQKWFAKTRREITLEYILLHEVNDRAEHARELAEVAKSIRANVNLIRYNEVKGMPFERPRDENVLTFQRILREQRVNTHIRASRGRDIAAACGQLRHEKQ